MNKPVDAANKDGEMKYIIFEDTIRYVEGFKREEGYYWFPGLPGGLGGWSIHETEIFPSQETAIKALLFRLTITKEKLDDKIKNLQNTLNMLLGARK